MQIPHTDQINVFRVFTDPFYTHMLGLSTFHVQYSHFDLHSTRL